MERLAEELDKIRIIDPHSHIDPRRPSARDLDDLLGDPCLRDLLLSAGFQQDLFRADVPPEQRVRAVERFLPAIANTQAYRWFEELSKMLFGLAPALVEPLDLRELGKVAERTLNQENWEENLFHRSRIEKVFLTNDFDDPLDGFDASRYVPCLRADPLIFGLSEASVIERLRQASGTDVGNASGLREAIAALVDKFAAHGARACAIGLPPDFVPLSPSEASADPKVRRILSGQQVSEAEEDEVAAFALRAMIQACADRRLPIELFPGIEREQLRSPARSGLRRWNRLPSLYVCRDLFLDFPRVPFVVSAPFGDANGELIACSCAFPNVYTCGHWWHSEAPALVERDLRARLQSVPKAKQIGYFSGAHKLEFIFPRFSSYRAILAKVLMSDFVTERGWSEERALELGRAVLRDNAERIFFRAEEAGSGS